MFPRSKANGFQRTRRYLRTLDIQSISQVSGRNVPVTERWNRTMRVTVSQWGNSLGLRLPKAIASALQLAPGSVLELLIEDGRLVAQPVIVAPSLDALLSRITRTNLHVPLLDDAPSAKRPRGREVW